MRSIIVVGPARSGTSLTAGVLHHLGVNMGNKSVWREADDANETGYFENSDFVNANISIIEREEVPDLESIVNKHKDDLWGAKDPRFLDTWDLWEPYIENPYFILCERSVESIVNSVCHRDDGRYSPKKVPENVRTEVLEYYKRLYKKFDKYPRLRIQYNNYFLPQYNERAIAEFIGVPHKKVELADINLKHF